MKPLELERLAIQKIDEFKGDNDLVKFWYAVYINACYQIHYKLNHPVIINEEEY